MRAAEQPLLDAGEPLMQRAADGLAAEVARILEHRGAAPGRVLALVGSGNNGGDALFACARLAAAGHRGTLVPLSPRLHADGLEAARGAGAVVVSSAEPAAIAALASSSDVVVDGILGTGSVTSPALRSPARDAVAAVLDARVGAAIVAVDLPSGIGPDDGSVHEPVLPADVTVTFGAVKAGLLRDPAATVSGRIVLVDIGLGPHLQGEPLLPAR